MKIVIGDIAGSLADAATGDVLATATTHLTRADLVAYANASGDQNPIHQDEEFAQSVGLPDVIAHGMLTMGLVGSLVEHVAGGADNVREFGTRFAAPVVVPADAGTDVDVELKLLSRNDDARTAVIDATASVAGTKVLSRTRATIGLS